MKIILYHGRDTDFYNELKVASETLIDCEIHQISPEVDSLSEQGFILKPHLIFIDAVHTKTLTEEVRWMKTIPLFQSTVMGALFQEESEVRNGEILLVAGVNLFHVLDTDSESFIQDSFQIAFGTRRLEREFPRAKNLKVQFSVGFFASLASVGHETFTVETDLNLADSVSITLPMSINAPMEISTSTDGGMVSPFLKTYEVKYPFAGPWETLDENSLQPETVETWIDLRKDKFDPRKRHLCLFTQDEKIIRNLPKKTSGCWYQIFSTSEDAAGKLYQSNPGIIFFDLSGTEGPDLRQLTEVLRAVRAIDSSPLLVIFNSQSDSIAMRKIFEYEYILSVPKKFDVQLFLIFEKAFLEKNASEEERYFLRPDDEERIIILDRPVILTSITERNLTFIIDSEIPYYTIARIDLPFPAYLTIVPSEGQLPVTRKGYHYSAIIHGLTDKNLAGLRKVVHQLSYKSVTTLTKELVEAMLRQDDLPKTFEEQSAALNPERMPDSVVALKRDGRFSLKNIFKGKSKL